MHASRLKRILGSTVLRAGVSLALLAWLIYAYADLLQLADIARGLALPPLIAAVALSAAGRVLVALRWKSVLRLADVRLPTLALLRTVFVTSAIGAPAPGSSLTEALRVYAVSRHAGLATAAGTTMIERAFALATMAAAGAIGMLLVDAGWPAAVTLPVAAVLLLPASLLAGLVIAAPRLAGRVGRLPLPAPLVRFLGALVSILSALWATPRVLLGLTGLTVAMQLVRILQTWLIGLAVGVTLDPAVVLLLAPTAFFAALLPISFLGLGVREATFVGILGFFDVSQAAAVLIGLLHVAVLFVAVLLPGLLIYVRHGVVPREQRKGAAAAGC